MINDKILWIVRSQFFIHLWIFVYIWLNSKLFALSIFGFDLFDEWQIGIWSLLNIQYSVYSDSHLNFKFDGKIKFIAISYLNLRGGIHKADYLDLILILKAGGGGL
jgi:hypothetical protein